MEDGAWWGGVKLTRFSFVSVSVSVSVFVFVFDFVFDFDFDFDFVFDSLGDLSEEAESPDVLLRLLPWVFLFRVDEGWTLRAFRPPSRALLVRLFPVRLFPVRLFPVRAPAITVPLTLPLYKLYTHSYLDQRCCIRPPRSPHLGLWVYSSAQTPRVDQDLSGVP